MAKRKITRDALPIFDPVIAGGLEDIEPDLQALYVELVIQRTDVPGELEKQASLYGWWAQLLAEAEFDMDKAERALKLHAAELDATLRRGGAEGKRVTDKAIENTILRDDVYDALHSTYLESRRVANILRYVVRSLEHRREMLVGLNMREMREYQAS